MGNLLYEWVQRIIDTWKKEALFSMVTSICAFFIDRRGGVGHSLVVSLESGLLALVLFALWHLATILWSLRIITGLHSNDDPRIEVSFVDERKEVIAVQHSAALELKNKGNSDALWVRIAPLKLRKRILYFHDVSDAIAPTDYRRFHAEVGDQWGYDSHHDLIRAMSEEWVSYEDHETRREVIVPMRIDYENAQGVRYEVSFELLYHGGKGLNQPADFKCIECRKTVYRRIITGGFIPYKGAS